MQSIFLLGLLGAPGALATSYSLQDTYSGSNFFNKFDFFTGADPTHGFVDYLSYNDAVNQKLIPNPSAAAWGVDNSSVVSTSSAGRASVRISSQTAYNHGLFIADIAHMPDSTCGLWPAYWLLGGGTWPTEGEIDIIEGVNNGQTNTISGHTSDGCTITNTGTGSVNSANCLSPGGSNTGCGISDSSTSSYGTGFNNVGGGVYAVEWTSSGFSVWHFARSSIPSSISSGNPDPSSDFGNPVATFGGSGCNVDAHFQNMNIVVDTTFCGDWAGAVYGSNNCPSSCTDYVANNPSAFDNAYWSFNSIKVYQASYAAAVLATEAESNTTTTSSSSPTTTAVASTTTTTSQAATTTATSTTSESSSAVESSSVATTSQASALTEASTSSVVVGTPWSGHRHGHGHTWAARRQARATSPAERRMRA